MAAASRELEILAAKIQAQLAPGAEVLHDVRLPGRLSGRKRQIDVLVRQQVGQYQMLIVLDCKDYKKPVDVKGVEEFHGLLQDVGANKGALISPKGFTNTAKTRAQGLQIDLYSPIDTDPHKWQARVGAPMLCDFRSAGISFQLMTTAPVPMRFTEDFYATTVAFDAQRKELGIPLGFAMEKWNNGDYPIEPGIHENLNIFDTPDVLIDGGYGQLVPIRLTVSLYVTKQLYFGTMPIKAISGFRDEHTGGIITNAFTTGTLDPEEVEKTWQKVASEDDVPLRPVMRLTGLSGWEA